MRLVRVVTLDFGPQGDAQREALRLLGSAVLHNPERANAAWNLLLARVREFAPSGAGGERSTDIFSGTSSTSSSRTSLSHSGRSRTIPEEEKAQGLLRLAKRLLEQPGKEVAGMEWLSKVITKHPDTAAAREAAGLQEETLKEKPWLEKFSGNWQPASDAG